MADDVEVALKECIAARAAAAKPLVFSTEALEEANQRTESQFRANLAKVGGWTAARDSMIRASTLYGAVAKAVAIFHNPDAKEINVENQASARRLMEQECKFRVARSAKKAPNAVTVADGLVC